MKTEIICILDRSGSMGSIESDVVGGFERFIADQKATPGEARITLIQFDNLYEKDYEGVPLETFPGKLKFQPRGNTALYDAIGRTLNEQGKRIAAEKWADLVLVNIVTDGGENSSNEYTQERVKEMTKHAEAHGWKFLFLAANQDAFLAAQAFGSSGQFSGNFQANSVGTHTAYATMSATSSAMRSGAQLHGLVPPVQPAPLVPQNNPLSPADLQKAIQDLHQGAACPSK